MTTLQQRIIHALQNLGGSATSHQIAAIITDKSIGSIATSLCFLRGGRVVKDGSSATIFPSGIAHTPAQSPITWTLVNMSVVDG